MPETPYVTPQKPAEPVPAQRAPLTAIDVFAVVIQLATFGTLAFWGFVAWPFPWNIVAGIGAPLVAILIWALFVSPRAVFAVHPFVRAFVELLIYVSATIALWSMNLMWVGIVYAVVAVTTGLLTGRRRLS